MIDLTFTQCKQIAALSDLRSTVENMNAQPEWLEAMGEGIDSFCTIQAVNQGGCASGAFMPAVTYYTAAKIMGEFGDDILEYLEDCYGNVAPLERGTSWGSYCCQLVSDAVELWCAQFSELESVNWD